MNLKRWIVIGVIAALAAVIGGPWVYIHLISSAAPAPLTAMSDDTAATTSSTGADTTSVTTDGSWAVASGSQVGYRVNEVLFGQSATAVGRTDAVTGSMQVSGTTIEAASFTVDMTTVASDESRRDNQFQNRIMQTGTYPTATFELTQPISFASVPADGASVTKTVTGKLTLRGTTKTVSVDLSGARSGDTISVKGSIPIVFAEWGIPNPSFGPVTTEDNGTLEFALNLARSS